MSRYRVFAQQSMSDDGWEIVSEHETLFAALAAAAAITVHVQVWDTADTDGGRLVHDNGKWPGEAT